MRKPSAAALIMVGVVALGLMSLWASHGPARVAEFTPWLVVGLTCVACGLAARRIVSWSLEWILLVVVGITWLLPDVASCLNAEPITHRCVSLNVAPWFAGLVGWLWLGIAGHAVIGFPDGRLTRKPLLLAVFVAYVLALGIGVGADPARPLLAVLLIAAPLAGTVLRAEPSVPAWTASTIASVGLGVAVLLDPGATYALEVGLVVASLSLFAGLAVIARSRAALTADRAVQLGPALASVLGDPTFRISVAPLEHNGRLRTSDHPVPDPAIPGGASTSIVRDGVEIARLTHDRSTLADPSVHAAVVKAVELEAHNTRLGADLRAQAEALAASRRRLLDAANREREVLGRQVEVDVMRRLDHLAREVQAVPSSGLATEAVERLQRAAEAIGTARAEVAELAIGLYPPALAHRGLVGALRELATVTTIDVRIDADDNATGGPDADATLYFLCAEALANADRHARASSVRIEIEHDATHLTMRVEDDGKGGADLAKGTGLRGLRDRVEALGGTLDVESPPGRGTCLVAAVPVDHEAS